MNKKISIIFVRFLDEKINKNLFSVCKKENINFYFLNFGKKIITKKKKIFNVKQKFMNNILKKIYFYKNPEYFMFINVSADEKYLTETIERVFWYYTKFKQKAGIIDFTTSCSNFYQIISEEPRFYPCLYHNLYKTFVANTYYFAVKKEIFLEAISKKIETSFFKTSFEFLMSFICFYKKYLICKDTTYKITLDNKKIKKTMKKNKSILYLKEKYFEKYTRFYYILFMEILVFIIWKIPAISFTFSSKSLGLLKPILKIKKLR